MSVVSVRHVTNISVSVMKMKRSEMIKKMTAKLQEWEDCKITDDTSKDLLDMMEEEGVQPMTPDWEWVPAPWNKGSDAGFTIKYNWEPEKK